MSKRKLEDKLLNRESILGDLRYVHGTKNCYVSDTGNAYAYYGNNKFYPLKPNYVYGYAYVGVLLLNGKRVTKRLHRLIARAFIPNPNKLPVVGHKNNIKLDNRVSNLYWTTVQENTQKAYDDGLAKNAKSWEDLQSQPVAKFDLEGNYICSYGSIGECSRETSMTKTGIISQCLHKVRTKPRKNYYYRFLSEYQESGFVL